MHFYTVDGNGEFAVLNQYELEGVHFVATTPANGGIPMYRWYHPDGRHFYTTADNGESAPDLGFTFEMVAFYVFASAQPDTVPLYRWYHPNGRHFWTTDDNGEYAPDLGYQAEGVHAHVYPATHHSGVPVHRWYQSGFMANATFVDDITAEQRLRTLQRHAIAFHRGQRCGNLSADERQALINVYRNTAIQHGINTHPDQNASATIGGNNLWINFGNLFPLGDVEISMTLIHEVMHLAGFTHPDRRDFDPANPTAPIDVPGDNGPYYGTPPLRAELCIAGIQTDEGRISLERYRRLEKQLRDRSAEPGAAHFLTIQSRHDCCWRW